MKLAALLLLPLPPLLGAAAPVATNYRIDESMQRPPMRGWSGRTSSTGPRPSRWRYDTIRNREG
jgi:hypothetical protein